MTLIHRRCLLARTFSQTLGIWATEGLVRHGFAGESPTSGVSSPPQPIRPGGTLVRVPTLDLYLADDPGLAQWWLPEMVLPGHTDRGFGVDESVKWEHDGSDRRRYAQAGHSGKLFCEVDVTRVEQGWLASMTLTNRSSEIWHDVVAGVCLLLHASPLFLDSDWRRTFYRANGEFKSYYGREREGGEAVYQMSLVQGRRQIERTERHQRKWGFTKDRSDDGVIAVDRRDRNTVLVTSWESTHHLQANQTSHYHCIHANPFFGDLHPGASRTVKGCVLLVSGGLDDAWRAVARELGP